jgi:formylglycine-generating enzyme required for sulfatase activity
VPLAEDVTRLTACLGPVLCTSPDEQQRFAHEVAEWLRRGGETVRSRPAPARVARPAPFQKWKLVRWGVAPVVAVAAIAIVCALLVARYYIPIATTGAVQVQLADGRVVTPSDAPGPVTFFVDGTATPLAGDGAFVVYVARANAVTVEARLEGYQTATQELTGGTRTSALLTLMPPATLPASPVPGKPVASTDAIGVAFSAEKAAQRIRWPIVTVGAFATAAIALGVLLLIDRIRRRLALGQLPVHGDPESVTLAVPEAHVLPTGEPDLRRVAIALRRPREGAALELDIPDTVDVTVRNAGFFQPRFSKRRAMPEYAVLVSRRAASDHQARTFDAVLKHLADQDVVIDAYSFTDDPRTCSSDQTGESYGLRAVLERHHRATLIVAGETLCAFNRVTGRLATWIETTQSQPSRIFVTTEAPDRWTDRESQLEQAGFVVVPASEAGWRVLANADSHAPADVLFPAPYTRPYPGILGADELRWLDRNQPPPDQIERLLRELNGFLGPDGFAWMCACAVYPEISWALTLRLKSSPSLAVVLPSLSRLPWFRHGFMPAWLRRSLVDHIPRAEDKRLRTDLERLLEELTRSHSRAESDSVLHIGRWIGPIDLLRAAPAGSPLQDHVFLGFMTGRRDSLWLDAPRALQWLFGSPPSSAPRRRDDAAGGAAGFFQQILARIRFRNALNPIGGYLALALAIGLVSLYPLTTLLAIDDVAGSPQSMWFVEIPEGPYALGGSATNVVNLRAFFISRTEVTVGQYNACIADGVCVQRSQPTTSEQVSDPPDWPIRNVTWREALQYCAWLEQKLTATTDATGSVADALSGRRDGIRWRVTLPSDAEWEKAATGGQRRRYPWGDEFDTLRANVNDDRNPSRQPTPVGSFPRGMSAHGLMDMWGNVSEWTRTAIGPDRTPGVNDTPQDLDFQASWVRVIRGASFSIYGATGFQSITDRSQEQPDSSQEYLGFRVAISPLSAPPLALPTPVAPPTTPSTPPPSAPSKPDPVPCVPRTGGVFAPVYFPEDSMRISSTGLQQLQQIADALKAQKGRLRIEGNVDSRMTVDTSLAVSQRLAVSVRDYLVSLGIASARLQTVALGKEYPQCTDDTPAARSANRRVEFKFQSGNSAPTIRGITQSPTGFGLPSTEFNFAPDGAVDPDGDQLTYEWDLGDFKGPSSDGALMRSWDKPGTYTAALTVTDTSGASAKASIQVRVGTLDGVWDLTCSGLEKAAPPSFPTSFVVTIKQNGIRITGTIEAAGKTQTFPAPASLENTVRSPRQVSFGVESFYNPWDYGEDFYFSVTLDDQLRTMTGRSGGYCASVRGVKRQAAQAR